MYNVSFRNIHVEEFSLTFYLANGITIDDIGKGVTIDTTAARTVKLAGDGDRVIGHLGTVENRTTTDVLVGAVDLKGSFGMAYTGTAPSIGEGLQGSATAGVLKTSGAAAAAGEPIVVYVDTTNETVEALFV